MLMGFKKEYQTKEEVVELLSKCDMNRYLFLHSVKFVFSHCLL